jgi:hypothetical protein
MSVSTWDTSETPAKEFAMCDEIMVGLWAAVALGVGGLAGSCVLVGLAVLLCGVALVGLVREEVRRERRFQRRQGRIEARLRR